MGKKLPAYTNATTDKDMVPSDFNMPPMMSPDKVRIPLHKRKSEILSHIAQAQGHRHAIDIAKTKTSRVRWTSADILPKIHDEQEGDDGWHPGPLRGDVPSASGAFTGDAAGVINKDLKHDTNAYFYVLELLPDELKREIMCLAADAVEAHCADNVASGKDLTGRDKAIDPVFMRASPQIFDLWLAARIQTAMLPIAVAQRLLWEPKSNFYKRKLDEPMPYHVYVFVNKFLQFTLNVDDADTEETDDVPEDGMQAEEAEQEEGEDENVNEGYDFAFIFAHGQVEVKERQLIFVATDNQTPTEIADMLMCPVDLANMADQQANNRPKCKVVRRMHGKHNGRARIQPKGCRVTKHVRVGQGQANLQGQ